MQKLPEDAPIATLRALRKALEHDVVAVFHPELNAFSVPSASHSAAMHQVTAADADPMAPVWFRCTCTAGEHRTDYPIPCWHAAAAALFMQGYDVIHRRGDGIFIRTR